MTEEMFACKCGFKCVMSTLYKTDGKCPKCGKNLASPTEYAKYGGK
jgi:hypothetical protein